MTDRVHPQAATDDPLQQMMRLQFAWQQLFCQMPLSVLSGACLVGKPAPIIAETKPEVDQHAQLPVPPAVADEGEHALFA